MADLAKNLFPLLLKVSRKFNLLMCLGLLLEVKLGMQKHSETSQYKSSRQTKTHTQVGLKRVALPQTFYHKINNNRTCSAAV